MCAFAAGTWAVQQLAELPDAATLALLPLAVASGFAGAARCRRQAAAELLAWLTAAAALGFGWAALRAQWRLADALPAAFEGRPLALTGTISGLPTVTPAAVRFAFDVERVDTPGATAPGRVQLSWYARDGLPPPRLAPGQRWTLTATLKRPHGNANFHGFDAEALSFARNLRAVGYVRDAPAPALLAERAGGLHGAVDRLRDAVRARIAAVLHGSAQHGVVVALALGDQSGISADDWTRFSRTGTSHLVAN